MVSNLQLQSLSRFIPRHFANFFITFQAFSEYILVFFLAHKQLSIRQVTVVSIHDLRKVLAHQLFFRPQLYIFKSRLNALGGIQSVKGDKNCRTSFCYTVITEKNKLHQNKNLLEGRLMRSSPCAFGVKEANKTKTKQKDTTSISILDGMVKTFKTTLKYYIPARS